MPVIPKTSFRVIFAKEVSWNNDQINLYNRILNYIDEIDCFSSPKIQLEQYSLPSDLIAYFLILSKYDLTKRNVVDLGCGTGRFTLPIRKFFSNRVLGVDIDPKAINTLTQRWERKSQFIDLLISPVEFLEPFKWGNKFQTTIMNPPFGTKRRKLDMVFLKQALKYSETIISINKSNPKTRNLIKKLGRDYSKSLEMLATVNFPLYPTLKFHRKQKYFVLIDLIRLA